MSATVGTAVGYGTYFLQVITVGRRFTWLRRYAADERRATATARANAARPGGGERRPRCPRGCATASNCVTCTSATPAAAGPARCCAV